jgi:hypothetical protein
MVLEFDGWKFRVDVTATMENTTKNSADHCDCAYCRNFYGSVDGTYPALRPSLGRFGIYLDGPSEVMPLEPTYILACYRVHGEIVSRAGEDFWLDDVRFTVECADDGTFLLWVGELDLPWILEEDMDEVVSPANLPEFMDRMRKVYLQRTLCQNIDS